MSAAPRPVPAPPMGATTNLPSPGRYHTVAGQPGAEPVDRSFDAACQVSGGEGVEVVLIGEQEHRGDALKLGTAGGGGRH